MLYHMGDIRIERMIDKLCVGAVGFGTAKGAKVVLGNLRT